jgi:urease accessory protein
MSNQAIWQSSNSAKPDAEALLALLQVSDSAFPAGTFAHSFGLEQLAREGYVKTPAEVEAFVSTVLWQSVATADAPAASAATVASGHKDIEALLTADRAYLRLKAAAELRTAALITGRRLLAETAVHVEDSFLFEYGQAVLADANLGAYPVAFGAVCSALGVRAQDAVAGLLLGAANAMLQAAMRLLPYSHRDAQAALHRLRPQMAAAATEIDQRPPAALASFHPLQEIASMRHVRADARLFMS